MHPHTYSMYVSMYVPTYIPTYVPMYVPTYKLQSNCLFFGAKQITCVHTYPGRTCSHIYLVVLYLLLNTYYCFSNSKFFSIDIYTKMNIYTFKNWLFGLFAKQPFSNLSPPTLCLHPVFCFIVGDEIDDIDDVDDNDKN